MCADAGEGEGSIDLPTEMVIKGHVWYAGSDTVLE